MSDCVDCQHNDDIAELNAEIERLRRGYDKLREYVEQQAAEGWSAPNALLDEIDAEEVSADGEETTEEEYEYGVGPEGAD